MRIMTLVIALPVTLLAACATKDPKTTPAAAPVTASATAPAGATAAATPAKTAEAKTAADGDWKCSKDADVRTIKIAKRDPKGCRLFYPAEDKEIASSANGEAHCIQVRSRIRENLEKSGFKCSN